MLFKVEVSKLNIHNKWQNYTVKTASDDIDTIQRFISKHNLKVHIIILLLLFALLVSNSKFSSVDLISNI